jgi:hypothetical protein
MKIYRGWLITLSPLLIAAAAYCATQVALSMGSRGKAINPSALLSVYPSDTYSCSAHVGEVVQAIFKVKNIRSASLNILGSKTTCSCTVATGLPLELAPGETGDVTLKVKVGNADSNGIFTKSAELFTNGDGTVPELTVNVTVLPTPKDN